MLKCKTNECKKTFLEKHKQTTEELDVTNEEDTYEVGCLLGFLGIF